MAVELNFENSTAAFFELEKEKLSVGCIICDVMDIISVSQIFGGILNEF